MNKITETSGSAAKLETLISSLADGFGFNNFYSVATADKLSMTGAGIIDGEIKSFNMTVTAAENTDQLAITTWVTDGAGHLTLPGTVQAFMNWITEGLV